MNDQSQAQLASLIIVFGSILSIIFLVFLIRMMYQVSQIKERQIIIMKKLNEAIKSESSSKE